MGIMISNIKKHDVIKKFDLFEFRKFEGKFRLRSRMNSDVYSYRLWVSTPFHLMTDGYYTHEYMSIVNHDDGYEIIADFAYFVYHKLKKVHPDILRLNYKIQDISTELPSKLVEEIITNDFKLTGRLKYVCDITGCVNDFYRARRNYMKAHDKSHACTEYDGHECGVYTEEYTRDVGISSHATKELYKPKTNYYEYKELERDI